MPAGAVADWGSFPTSRANSLAPYSRTGLPPSVVCPSCAWRILPNVLSSVDFPHALGPMIAVIASGSMETETPCSTSVCERG